MIIEYDAVNYMNQTILVQPVSTEVNLLLGISMIIVGLYLFNIIMLNSNKRKNETRKLKQF